MRPGTIVVCLHVEGPFDTSVEWLPVMDEKTPYMIREFISGKKTSSGMDGVYFEEGVIGKAKGKEIAFPASYVREILPTDDISEMIEEMMLKPVTANLQIV